jgi:pyruvate dehydrogenase E2 component (dihydrolipoamide acetyltransferase)
MMRLMVEGLKAAPRLNAHMKYNHTSSSGKLIVKKHIDPAMPYIFETGETFPIKVLHAEEKTLKELQFAINDVIDRAEKSDINRVLFDLISQRMVGFVLNGKLFSTVSQIASGFVGKGKVTKVQDILKKSNQDGTELLLKELNEGTVCFTNWGSVHRELEGNIGYTPLLYPQVFLFGFGAAKDKNYPYKNEKGEVDIETKKMLPINLVFDHRLGAFNDTMPFVRKLEEIFANPEVIREW